MTRSSLLLLAVIFMLLGTFATATYTNRPRLSISNEKHVSCLKNDNPLTPDFVFHNYTQTLDHFNYKPESYMTFQQRYFVNSKYWGGPNTSSPIFVYMGAEISVIKEVLLSGFFPVLASKFHGLLVYIEVSLLRHFSLIITKHDMLKKIQSKKR